MYAEAAVYKYLKKEIFPQIAPPPYGDIHTVRLNSGKPVCLFFERTKNIMVVGKSFKCQFLSAEEAWIEAEKEYLNLKLLRERYRMGEDTDQVVAPLGDNEELAALLITEKAPGKTLDYYIAKAIYEQRHEDLLEKLGHLARFFAKLHKGSEIDRMVTPDLPQLYMQKLLDQLRNGTFSHTIEQYADRWWKEDSIFTTDKEVIVHGDANPTNFLFYQNNVMGVDLEEMKWADRCWDLGFISAELKHHFMWRRGNGWAAEPFIGHFLRDYAANYGDDQFFCVITRKLPLYMAMGLLRIARNTWLDEPYRKTLVTEAEQCLRCGLLSLTATVPS